MIRHLYNLKSDDPDKSSSHLTPYISGIKLIFTRGHISLEVTFKGPNVILGLYKCNYSLTRGKELGAAAG